MSRYKECDDDDESFPNAHEFWRNAADRALRSRRGRRALEELREALLHLPERRLISSALCTMTVEAPEPPPRTEDESMGAAVKRWAAESLYALIQTQGRGVCANGAYIWWLNVKGGMDPEAAFAALPLLDDEEHDIHDTARAGVEAGLAFSLSWDIAFANDERFGSLTPEQRHTAMLGWIEEMLAKPPLEGAPRRQRPAAAPVPAGTA